MNTKFDTETEKAFSDYMKINQFSCQKIKPQKIKTPDFMCSPINRIGVAFEIKEFREGKNTIWLGPSFVFQPINFYQRVNSCLRDADEKFLNPSFSNTYTGLVLNNLRPLILWETFTSEVKKTLIDNFNKYIQVGNLILLEYSKPYIKALHIYENPFSKKVIPPKFFQTLKHKYYNV